MLSCALVLFYGQNFILNPRSPSIFHSKLVYPQAIHTVKHPLDMAKYSFSEPRLSRALAFIHLLFVIQGNTDHPKVRWQADSFTLVVKCRNYGEFIKYIKESIEDYSELKICDTDRKLTDEIGIICSQLEKLEIWKAVGDVGARAATDKTYQVILSSRDEEEVRAYIREKWKFPPLDVRLDWGGAPLKAQFFGRERELEALRTFVVQQKAKVVIVTGIAGQGKSSTAVRLLKGGNGKTDLALKFAEIVQGDFEYIIWRSLKNHPRCTTVLSDLIKFVSNQRDINLQETSDAQRQQLLELLARNRCLVVLDNAETVINDTDYSALFDGMSSGNHKSCLLLTTREIPRGLELSFQTDLTNQVRVLDLQGVDWKTGKKIVQQYCLRASGSDEEWQGFVENNLKGNPLALELAGIYLQKNCGGLVSRFLQAPQKDFSSLRQYLLDSLFNGLKADEKRIVFWLAINRGPVLPEEICRDFPYVDDSLRSALDTITNLSNPKMPIEHSELGFSLQEVLMEYFTERFVDKVFSEIRNADQPSRLDYFNAYWMIKATAKDYLRESQVRFIIRPILSQLEECLGSKSEVYTHLINLLGAFKSLYESLSDKIPGYLAGNILNMIISLTEGEKVYGIDFSRLPVHQAYLAETSLHNLNFSDADLSKSVFRQILGGALAMAMSADGKLLAVGDAQNEIHIWRISDYQKCGLCKGHTDWVRSIAISQDGSRLISGSEDQTVRVWDLDDPFDDEKEVPLLNTFSECGGKVWCVAISPDNRVIACGSDDGGVRFLEQETGTLFLTRYEHKARIRSIAFHPDSNLVASSGEDGVINLWDIPSRRVRQELKVHPESIGSSYQVGCVLFSPDGTKLVSGDSDSNVRVWDFQTGDCIQTFSGHSNSVVSLAFSPDSQVLASSGWDTTIRLWDFESLDSVISLKTLGGSVGTDDSLGHKKRVTAIAFSSDSQTVVSCSEDETVKFWDVEQGSSIQTFRGYSNWFMSVAFLSSNSNLLASGSNDGGIRLWDTDMGECLRILEETQGSISPDQSSVHLSHVDRVWCLNVSASKDLLVSGSDDSSVKLWDLSDVDQPKHLQTFRGHNGRRISSVALSADAKTLATCGHDRILNFWNIETGKVQNSVELSDLPWSVASHPTENIFATGGNDKEVKIWNVDGTFLNFLKGHLDRIRCVVFSYSGNLIASCGDGHTVRIWDYHTGECLHVLQEHTREVMAVVFSPDDLRVASVGYDGLVIVWDVATGRSVHTLTGHTDMLWGLAFSQDGRKLASAGQDETIRVWDLKENKTDVVPSKELHVKKPYEGMNLTRVKGVLPTQRKDLVRLGAFEEQTVQ
jgi:WD40 repeat protein